MIDNQTSNPQFKDPLTERYFLSPIEKTDKEKGRLIVKAFYSMQTANDSSTNFFKMRNARWIEILQWVKGSQKMVEFLDFMNIDGSKAYVNVDMTQTRLAAQFVGTLVESMAKNKVYSCVDLTDDGSVREKEQRMYDALFRMHDAQTVNALQQGAGMALEPVDAYVPDDEMSAKVYFELEDRLPKAIRFEKMLKKLQDDIQFERIVNRKTIFDLTVLNAGFTKIERCAPGEYTARKCIATNMVYNFFMNDLGDYEITQIGEFWNIKVKDFRAKFGKTPECPDGLTEKEIFDLAKLSTHKNIGSFNYMWNDNWNLTPYDFNRPYDDCSILVFDCEINCGEDVYYVDKKDPFGKSNITQKQSIPYQQKTKDGRIVEQPKPDNVEIIKRQRNPWMRGVYAPYGDKMLYWGPPDIIITPYTNVSKPLCSYTGVIPGNDGEYVPSLFERIMEPLREYQITKLKRKQLIAKIKPSGIRIDVESARNIDLGNGDSISWEEIVRIYDQTGCEIWSSKGVDPLQREAPPLSNTVHDESIEKVIGLTNVLAGIVAEIRQLIGVPSYRDGADVGDRTPAKLAEGQNESSFNVTDFVVNANNQLWEQTFYKICLLHWNDIVKSEPESKNDMLDTRFDVRVKTKATEYEKQRLEQDIQRYSQMPDAQGNPSITLKDAMFLREIDDYKLACWYLSTTFEKNRRNAMEESAKLQQQNQALQQQSAMQAQQQEAMLAQQKAAQENQTNEAKFRHDKELALINLFAGIMSKTGGEIPTILQPLATQMFQNISMDIVMDNMVTKAEISQAMAETQQAEAQQQQQPEMQPQQ